MKLKNSVEKATLNDIHMTTIKVCRLSNVHSVNYQKGEGGREGILFLTPSKFVLYRKIVNVCYRAPNGYTLCWFPFSATSSLPNFNS